MSHYNDFNRSNTPNRMNSPRGFNYSGNRQVPRTQSQQFYPPTRSNRRQNQFENTFDELPMFDPEKLKYQKDIVLLETMPCTDEIEIANHPLCSLIDESIDNQNQMRNAFGELLNVMGETDEFIAKTPDIHENFKQIYNMNCDLKSRYMFMNELNDSLFQSVDNFFTN